MQDMMPVHYDGLRVKVRSCLSGEEIPIYDKSGSELATVSDQQTSFVPIDCNDWRTECVNMDNYAGQVVELIFENVSGWGNKLYIDNIRIIESQPFDPCYNTISPNIILDDTGISFMVDSENDMITINGQISDFKIEIVDTEGNIFNTMNGTNVLNISTSGLPQGLYFLTLTDIDNNTVSVQRILQVE